MYSGVTLQELNPPFLKEWDHDKNNPVTPNDVTRGSTKKVWWLCPKGHSYKTRICSRTSGFTGCPYCAGRKVLEEDSLLTRFPKIASEWDYEKNEGARPEHYSPKCNKKLGL